MIPFPAEIKRVFSGSKQFLFNAMDTTPRKRASIITLKEHTNKSNREIAKIFGLSHTTVSRILKLKEETGSATREDMESAAGNGRRPHETTKCWYATAKRTDD